MRKNFNSVQMLETSDVCNKFSKSVSYETLVDGTATIGTDIKQTQRLSEGSADKPLTAVGTLTSLPCNSTKVMEKWLQTLPIVRLIKVLGLVVVLSVGTLSESLAETWTCGAKDANGEYSDSVKCTYDEKTKTMTVSGKGNMGNYSAMNKVHYSSAPWFGIPIENVVIGEGVTSVGALAFAFNYSLKSVSGMKDVERLESNVFNGDGNITSFVMPEKVKYIGTNALQGPDKLGGQVFELPDTLDFVGVDGIKFSGVFIIPDSINTEEWDNEVFTWHNPTFVCKGNINVCQSKIAKFIKKTEGGIGTCETERCLDNDAYTLVEANIEQCTGNYGWNGKNCVKKDEDGNVTCASGFVEWENQCWDEYPFAKKRWTPAEANKWLHDGNDNFVIITFKK